MIEQVVEKKTPNLANKIIEDGESPLVRHLMKHQSYCQILIDICSGKNFLVHERNKLLKLIEMCIKLEIDLIQHLQQMLNENDLPAANFLQREYEKEEKEHYNMLKQLLERVFRVKSPEKRLDPTYSRETVFRLEPSLRLFLKELKRTQTNSKGRSALIL